MKYVLVLFRPWDNEATSFLYPPRYPQSMILYQLPDNMSTVNLCIQ